MKGINEFYGHIHTAVLLVDTELPPGPKTNSKQYIKRGWCLMEKRLASLVKCSSAYWRLSAWNGAGSYAELRRYAHMGIIRKLGPRPHRGIIGKIGNIIGDPGGAPKNRKIAPNRPPMAPNRPIRLGIEHPG